MEFCRTPSRSGPRQGWPRRLPIQFQIQASRRGREYVLFLVLMRESIFIVAKVIPIISDPPSIDSWKSLLATIDAVIDTTGGGDVTELAPTIFNAISEAVAAVRPPNAIKLTFI